VGAAPDVLREGFSWLSFAFNLAGERGSTWDGHRAMLRVRPSARRCVVAACASVLRSDGRCQGLEVLEGFRNALYGCATRRADAWFELGDALLTTDRLLSLPHLSLDPVHRRGHGSIYAALTMPRCRPNDCGNCWRPICRPGHRCLRWIRRCGRAVMRSAPQVEGSTTTLAALGRAADRGGLVLPADRGPGAYAQLLDRPGGRAPPAAGRQQQPGRGRADP
jgi:hypothetical protein